MTSHTVQDRYRIWWQLIAFCFVCGIAAYVGVGFNSEMQKYVPEAKSFPSIYNEKPSGYSGLAKLARVVGVNRNTWELPYRRLKEVKGTLLVVAPAIPIAPFEYQQILTWVAEGNNLVYLDHFVLQIGKGLLKELGLEAHVEKSLINAPLPLNNTFPEREYANKLVISAEARLDHNKLSLAELADESGVLLAVIRHGKGRCLVGSVPSLCSNLRFADKNSWSNFQFLINWLRESPGTVFFDEKCHGYSSAPNFFIVVGRSPIGLIVAQLLIVFLMATISQSKHFGMPKLVAFKRQISSLEFIEGLSATYKRASAQSTAWTIIFNHTKSHLCKALAVSPEDSYQSLAHAWSQATNINYEECEAFLLKCTESLTKEKLATEEFIFLVQTSDKLLAKSKEIFAEQAPGHPLKLQGQYRVKS